MQLLWSDTLYFLTLSTLIMLLAYSAKSRLVRQQMTALMLKPLALSSLVILVFFILIATLDSIHLTPVTGQNSHLYSVLDKLLSPLNQDLEKTYSKPMARVAYTAEIDLLSSPVKQFYPVLNYPPKGINRAAQVKQSLARALLYSSVLTWIICQLGFFAYVKGCSCQIKLKLAPEILAGVMSLFFCLALLLFSFNLSRSFHPLGTGIIGQDIFYQTVKSVRTGMLIGTLTSLFMVPLALITGVSAGYFGGLVDDIIQYVYITISSVPGVLLITASVLSLQTYITNHPQQFPSLNSSADARLLALCFILGVTSWTNLCRLLRAETLKLRSMDYIQAAKCLGSSSIQILCKHLIPNMLPIIIMTVVLDFSFLILAEAVLSYVGVGVSPLTISWGNMINSARLELAREPVVWWPILAAFTGMFTLVLSVNLFADAVRDVLDPRAH